MRVRTSELTGSALDWAVASAMNGTFFLLDLYGSELWGGSITEFVNDGRIQPSMSIEQCYAIMNEYRVDVRFVKDGLYSATGRDENGNTVVFPWCPTDQHATQYGDTMMIAACRLVVAGELGEFVDVPSEFSYPASFHANDRYQMNADPCPDHMMLS